MTYPNFAGVLLALSAFAHLPDGQPLIPAPPGPVPVPCRPAPMPLPPDDAARLGAAASRRARRNAQRLRSAR
jgi:hypothetical protein